MDVIIFCGIQATGKSSFYQRNFFRTHVHISMDLLKTRYREMKFVDVCIDTFQSFVVDNTNPTVSDRAKYIHKVRDIKDCRIIGYYFQSKLDDALERNKSRIGKENIPDIGIRATYNKLELPSFGEGFDELYYVTLVNGEFNVTEWKDEI
ncbi:MAG: hypothetical protein QM660_01320 [Dysgonomonas sp.]